MKVETIDIELADDILVEVEFGLRSNVCYDLATVLKRGGEATLTIELKLRRDEKEAGVNDIEVEYKIS